MAVIGNLAPTFVFTMKAIPTLGLDTDSLQIGGSTDGLFHGEDADETNIKPFRFYDLGSGHFAPGVNLRSAGGLEIGVAANPLVVSGSGGSGVALEATLSELKNRTPRHGYIFDAGVNIPIQHVVVSANTSLTPVTIIAAPVNAKIRVLGYSLNAIAVITGQFEDSAEVAASNTFYAISTKAEQASGTNFLFELGQDKALKMGFTAALIAFSVRVDYALIPV